MTEFFRRLRRNEGGQVAVIFAICGTVLVMAIGAGIDLSRVYVARQQLSNAATLTCQYSARPAVVAAAYNGGSAIATYTSNVDASAAKFINAQKFPFTQTNSSPFTYTQGVSSSVKFTATIPTFIMGMIGVNTIPIGATVNCATGQIEVNDTNPSVVISESFESVPCAGTCWGDYSPSGLLNVYSTTPTNTFPTVSAYTGLGNAQWTVMGYCLEIDTVGITVNTEPDGTHNAELDCDNGSGTAGNSSISNKSYYTAGTYELRYNYVGRVDYPNYDPTYICGSTAADVAWANDTNSNFGAKLRTNQINVYFDPDNNGSPGTHTTIDGTQQLAGVDLIDMCVYSSNWIQRSVKINITTAGYYWLSFAADGTNDSKGGQLDNIQLCRGSCSGSVTNNFPTSWPNSPLFEDTFESPTYPQQSPYPFITGYGNLSNSVGTTGTSSSGWPSQAASGWATAPYNQVEYFLQGAAQGSQYISLDGNDGYATGSVPACPNVYTVAQGCQDRMISRPFLLDPGYYQLSYDYISELNFAIPSGTYGTICTAAPSSGFIYPAPSSYPAATGTIRFQGLTTKDGSDNIVGVFMSHGSLISTPNLIPPNTSNSFGATTTYTNPDGSVTAVPTVPPDGVNWASYNSGAVNPVIDTCGYVDSWRWVPRTTYVQITKPGVYWLTFSANGGWGDSKGPNIDDVKLTALNSLYGSPPSFYVKIPTPSAAPGSTINYTGFSIVADPLTP